MNALDKNIKGNEIVLNQKNIELGHDFGDWFIFRETRHFGPLTTKQVNQYLLSRLISTGHFIWRPGFESWVPIKQVESFRAFGHSDIDFITDNDFSFQAQLGPIDRIKFQETDISFHEGASLNVVQLNMNSDNSNKVQNFKTLFSQNYDLALSTLGLNKEYRTVFNIGLSVLLGSIFIVSALALFNADSEESYVNKLPKSMRDKLKANSELPENNKNPNLVIFEKDGALKDPVLVGSVNLPLGSRIEIDIKGKPNTLVGSYRFSKKMEITLQSKFFQTEPVRGLVGQYLSAGKYSVVVKCLSCEKEGYLLSSSVYSFGINNFETYRRDLKAFHIKSRESAGLELEELTELSDTLQEQYQDSLKVYNRSIAQRSSSSWNKYSIGWLSNQKKIVELFEQIESEEFKSKLYYLSLYQAYGDLTRMIFEMHLLQDKYLSGSENKLNIAEKINEASQSIKLKLTYLKSQTELMTLNFNQSKELPSKQGLNLSKI